MHPTGCNQRNAWVSAFFVSSAFALWVRSSLFHRTIIQTTTSLTPSTANQPASQPASKLNQPASGGGFAAGLSSYGAAFGNYGGALENNLRRTTSFNVCRSLLHQHQHYHYRRRQPPTTNHHPSPPPQHTHHQRRRFDRFGNYGGALENNTDVPGDDVPVMTIDRYGRHGCGCRLQQMFLRS